ncbi:MAG: ABC transporter ATP-binding protein [Chloroflexi bacterium]|nr:ABC transporter ATP-binding protein [Chloroflexota bacterium]MCH8875798.1 ABC transporter ATP-binding protein [Chloroflexota bacterium]MCI0771826.1 ABC transporter ATP-binding protein [Chloroflexota bacterium]MCI0806939.1 ABC transporter ATP-binding protein [Chloroflexota bacterium]MCI0826248.1 ABC transporter ATP-binding protein [Chloroflexota bacterium]
MNEPFVEVNDLTIGYRNRQGQIVNVLRGVSLVMPRGGALGLVGESGSGKSTLGMALLGHLRAGSQVQAGTVRFEGVDPFALNPAELQALRGGRIALIPQNAAESLTPTMRVGDQIVEVLQFNRILVGAEARDLALELLGQVRLPQPEAMFTRYPHELSGGQQQRVAVAKALAGEPELLVLDEPTTGLDVTTQAHLLDLLAEIVAQMGTAMLYISHDLGVIARVSDRVAVMYAGEIVEVAAVTDIFARPTHPYTRGLLASIPRLTQAGIPKAMPGQPPTPGEHGTGCSFTPRCTFADGTCETVAPTLDAAAQPGQLVRCHHWQTVAKIEFSQELQQAFHKAVRKVEPEPAVELAGVEIAYTRQGLIQRLRGLPEPPATVSDITLTVHKGETLALVGESGSGKTTIVRTIAGLMLPRMGSLKFKDYDLNVGVDRRPLELRQQIQLIFQNPDASLNPRHTVAEILDQPLRLYFNLSRSERRERSIELLERVRLGPHYRLRYPGQLSGGEKQRVAIARAFAAEPQLVLCDEVTSALDVSVQAAVLDLLAELQAEHGVTYIFIAHDLALVHAFADRVAVLYQGRLCEVGSTDEIYTPPHHPYTETLLAAAPRPVPGLRPHLLGSDVPELAPPPRGCPFQRRCPRRIGSICDEEAPPWRVPVEGHRIRCHIPLDELETAQVSAAEHVIPLEPLSNSVSSN